MRNHLSTRSRVLSEILRYINDGSYKKVANGWSFGTGWGASRDVDGDEAVFEKMRRLVYDHVARTIAIQRTSLATPPSVDWLASEFRELMEELTPENREAFGKAIAPIAEGQDSPVSTAAPERADQLDALDRYYSAEILEKLDGIVCRAAALDRLGLEIVPNRRVQFLFEEAHRCYLYGFYRACSVFCRAIVEGALKEVADPESETSQSIHDMIALAMEKRLLSDDRPGCAREVAKAGNRAIHDPEKFDRDYSAERVEEILTHTRKVLEELYRQPSG